MSSIAASTMYKSHFPTASTHRTCLSHLVTTHDVLSSNYIKPCHLMSISGPSSKLTKPLRNTAPAATVVAALQFPTKPGTSTDKASTQIVLLLTLHPAYFYASTRPKGLTCPHGHTSRTATPPFPYLNLINPLPLPKAHTLPAFAASSRKDSQNLLAPSMHDDRHEIPRKWWWWSSTASTPRRHPIAIHALVLLAIFSFPSRSATSGISSGVSV